VHPHLGPGKRSLKTPNGCSPIMSEKSENAL
jgi:hypothetical protein